jgi:hypothetical protein
MKHPAIPPLPVSARAPRFRGLEIPTKQHFKLLTLAWSHTLNDHMINELRGGRLPVSRKRVRNHRPDFEHGQLALQLDAGGIEEDIVQRFAIHRELHLGALLQQWLWLREHFLWWRRIWWAVLISRIQSVSATEQLRFLDFRCPKPSGVRLYIRNTASCVSAANTAQSRSRKPPTYYLSYLTP